jgi:K+ transporter
MHKKLEAELVSLAHSVLQLKNDEEIAVLYKKAQAIYEKLAIAKFLSEQAKIENNTSVENQENIEIKGKIFNEDVVAETSQNTENKEDMLSKISNFEQVEFSLNEEEIVFEKNEIEEKNSIKTSLEEEFKDAISSTEATKIFENVTKENPILSEKTSAKNRTLNDALFKNNLQIGLNDRIAFVNQLFNGSQEDFNRVISQLNTFNSEEEAKNFLLKLVKPDYDWSNKQEFEERLLMLIERKFT